MLQLHLKATNHALIVEEHMYILHSNVLTNLIGMAQLIFGTTICFTILQLLHFLASPHHQLRSRLEVAVQHHHHFLLQNQHNYLTPLSE